MIPSQAHAFYLNVIIQTVSETVHLKYILPHFWEKVYQKFLKN